jgi:hypothetical protein
MKTAAAEIILEWTTKTALQQGAARSQSTIIKAADAKAQRKSRVCLVSSRLGAFALKISVAAVRRFRKLKR